MPADGRIALEALFEATFAPFGKLIRVAPEPEDDRFEVVIEEPEAPWRVAVFRVRQHAAARLEAHPSSMETFEPVGGTGVLLVAAPDAPGDVRAFLLDTPVCLRKGIWHEVIALSAEALYKITENACVDSIFYPLDHTLGFWVG